MTPSLPGETVGFVRPLVVFLAIAFGLPWLLWLLREGTGIDIVAPAGMLSVGLATLVAIRVAGGPGRLTETGVLPIRPVGRLLRQCALGLGMVLGLGVAAILIGALAGTAPLDPVGLSGLRTLTAADGPAGVVLGAQLLQSLLLFVILLPLAFCEEWGWRGFLLLRLRPLGLWPALLLSGLIWGLWHLPGYVSGSARPGLVPFLIFTIAFGTLLGWLRLRTGSVWPGTVVHAANNTIVIGFVNVALSDAGVVAAPDPWSYGFSGWPGWLLIAGLVVVLALTGRFGERREIGGPDLPGVRF